MFFFLNFEIALIQEFHIYAKTLHWLRSVLNTKQNFDSMIDIVEHLEFTGTSVVFALLIFIYLIIFRFEFQEALSIYVSLLAVIVIFTRSSLTSMLDSLHFVFVVHPFSVGDMVYIDGVRYVVYIICYLKFNKI